MYLPEGWASEAYETFCQTTTQLKYLRAVVELGTNQKAANKCGVSRQSVDQAMRKIYANATLRGYDPANGVKTVMPEGMEVHGVSRMVDAEGNTKVQWVKADKARDSLTDQAKAIMEGMVGDIKPVKAVKTPLRCSNDWMCAIPIGDAHIGMYAHHSDAGGDFDLSIAHKDFTTAAKQLIDWSEPSAECLIAQVGDYFHADDLTGLTPNSKNLLDTDSRRYKVLTAGVGILREIIDMALKKHKVVRVRNARGNHDPNAHMMLDIALKGYYHKEPRVIIEDSQQEMWWTTFGDNLIGVTHGDKIKPKAMAGVLAVDAPQWSQCSNRYVWYGHLHSTEVHEDLNCTMERFQILAPNDAWHQASGYRGASSMHGLMLHKQFGEMFRHKAGLQLIRSLQK